jgi:hypothetical protein
MEYPACRHNLTGGWASPLFKPEITTDGTGIPPVPFYCPIRSAVMLDIARQIEGQAA